MALSQIMNICGDFLDTAAASKGLSGFVSSPCTAAFVCFVSGLLGSAVLTVAAPSMDEESDLRSFISFAIGAVLCCLFTKYYSFGAATKPVARTLREKKVPTQCSSPNRNVMQDQKTVAFRAAYTKQAGSCGSTSSNFETPPGLSNAGAVSPPWRKASRVAVADEIPAPAVKPMVSPTPAPYSPQTFRKDVAAIMRDLSSHRNVAVAVQHIRARNVPVDRQAEELVDILTYALEETRGGARRSYIAFVGGLTGTFDKFECVAGFMQFFNTVYDDLSAEVPRLDKLIRTELVPILTSVLSTEEFAACIPAQFNTF